MISVVFIPQLGMDHQSIEEIQMTKPWYKAVYGENPYILPFCDEDWQCMDCRAIFTNIDKHWHDFHSQAGPKNSPYTIIGV